MTKVGVPVRWISSLARLGDRHDSVGEFLVLEALGRLGLGHAGRAHGGDQRLERLVDEGPLVLLGEQEFVGGEGLVVAEAAGEHEAGDIERVAGEFAEDEAHLAGVDIFLLQLREGLLAEDGAVRAGQRAVFDHRHAIRGTFRELRQRPRRQHLGHVDGAVGLGRAGGERVRGGERRGADEGGAGEPAEGSEGHGERLLTIEGDPNGRDNALKRADAASLFRPRQRIIGLAAKGWHASSARPIVKEVDDGIPAARQFRPESLRPDDGDHDLRRQGRLRQGRRRLARRGAAADRHLSPTPASISSTPPTSIPPAARRS